MTAIFFPFSDDRTFACSIRILRLALPIQMSKKKKPTKWRKNETVPMVYFQFFCGNALALTDTHTHTQFVRSFVLKVARLYAKKMKTEGHQWNGEHSTANCIHVCFFRTKFMLEIYMCNVKMEPLTRAPKGPPLQWRAWENE